MFTPSIRKKTAIALFVSSLFLPTITQAAEEMPAQPTREDVQRFSRALSEIKEFYVSDTTDEKLFDNAINGMLTSLDPHSAYLNEADYMDLQTDTSGKFGGLGIEVTMEDGVVKVITPVDDTPAARGGVKAGDYIIKLGDKAVEGLTLKDAVALMRGEVGQPIELTILRKGETKPIILTLVREKIQIKSVKSKLLDNEYGYIKLAQFQASTAKDMTMAIKVLKQQAGGNLKGLILDLRNNPGGLLEQAVLVSDEFIQSPQGTTPQKIVYTQGRVNSSNQTWSSTPGDILDNAPMVVLINGGSASAAEIVAGALQDDKRAIVLGTRSFGKGSVQSILPLDDTHAIKLTTALYYTPSGRSIQATGIQPDILVEEVSFPSKEDEKVTDKTLGITEASLSGHIKVNPEKEASDPNQAKALEDQQALLHDDYQLNQALTILKGLSIAKK